MVDAPLVSTKETLPESIERLVSQTIENGNADAALAAKIWQAAQKAISHSDPSPLVEQTNKVKFSDAKTLEWHTDGTGRFTGRAYVCDQYGLLQGVIHTQEQLNAWIKEERKHAKVEQQEVRRQYANQTARTETLAFDQVGSPETVVRRSVSVELQSLSAEIKWHGYKTSLETRTEITATRSGGRYELSFDGKANSLAAVPRIGSTLTATTKLDQFGWLQGIRRASLEIR